MLQEDAGWDGGGVEPGKGGGGGGGGGEDSAKE